MFLQKLVTDGDFISSMRSANSEFARSFDETFLVIFLAGGLLLYFFYPLLKRLEERINKRRGR